MEKEIEELQTYLKNVVDFTLPKFKELPGIDLYMEQILSYINDCLHTLNPKDEKILTSFMVNNYVKAKMVDEPKKKKYGREQIGYLLAISLCKSTVSMSDMSLLIDLDGGVSTNKERLYEFWSSMENSVCKEAASKLARHVDIVSHRYESEKLKDKEAADNNARDSLALLAWRLAIQAQANKMLSDYIIATLRKDMQGEELARKAEEKDGRQTKHEIRAEGREAKRVSSIKVRSEKNRKEEKNDKASKNSRKGESL